MVVIPDEGKLFLLDQLLRMDPAEMDNFRLRLFQNNVTIAADTVRSNLTESNFAGYSSVELVRATWSAPIISAGKAQSNWGGSLVEFVPSSGSQACFGYFVTDWDDNFVLWGENKVPSVTLSPTNPLNLLPVMRLRDLLA